jgi:nicotinamide mononucleotide transporter
MQAAELLASVGTALATSSPIELVAAATGILYLVLVIRQNALCWVAAFISTALYLYVFYAAALYLQALLQIFYLGMAVYGWWQWRDRGGGGLPIQSWAWTKHVFALAGILLFSAAVAWLMARAVNSAAPWLDSVTTWASVFTTWLVARKVLENWIWWFAIDAVIAMMCWQQRLYPSALLYASFLILVVLGWRTWRRDLRAQVVAT